MSQKKKEKKIRIIYWLSFIFWGFSITSWITFTIIFFNILGNIPNLKDNPEVQKLETQKPDAQTSKPEDSTPRKSGNLKIFDSKTENYTEWDRQEAIKFGFSEMLATINYLFIAAGAILAFIGKSVIEPAIRKEENEHLSSFWSIWFLANCAIASALSVFFGFVARSYFITLGNEAFFSIYEQAGISLLFQELTFFIAILFLAITIGLTAIKKGFIQTTKESKRYRRRR